MTLGPTETPFAKTPFSWFLTNTRQNYEQNYGPQTAELALFHILSGIFVHIFALYFGQEKANEHKHFGWDGVRDKHEPSLGQIGTRPWDKPAFFCLSPQ